MLFLDEIGEMSPGMQAKLLRAIEQGEIRPVGSEKTISVNVRIISATNKELKILILDGKFREDLYYRLQGFTIILPPLRERKEDVPLLINHFLKDICQKTGKKLEFRPETLRLLMDYNWPGNIRELKHEIERATTLSKGRITPEVLSPDIKKKQSFVKRKQSIESFPSRTLTEMEAEAIRETLKRTGGNRNKAARLLGIGKTTLYAKMKRYDLRI
jgi:transcriptional regulator with PAS, ATPase and Fis domain